MSKSTIATPRKMPLALAGALKEKYTVIEPSGEIAELPEFLEMAKGVKVLFITAFDAMDSTVINALPDSVDYIASLGVGVDHIDLTAVKKRGLMISNTPEVTTPCLADMTIGLMIAACRRFREGLDVAQTGEGRGMLTPDSWGQRVSGRTLGIIGMGNVGKAVAKRAKAFDMKVIYTTPRPSRALDEEFGASAVDLYELLKTADVISLHCPLKEETHHLIDAKAIELMKTSAVIINISRGPIIDEVALISALKSGRIFAAGLDVFETEPDPIRAALRELPNAFCLPHIASATWESRAGMAMCVLGNIDAYFENGTPTDRAI